MIQSRSFNTTPGVNQIFHPSLVGVRVLGVEREGLGYTKVPFFVTPGNREFKHPAGRIIFDTTNPFNLGEKVWVLWEE